MNSFEGVVFSDKMNKAAVVIIERSYRHPKYGKILRLKQKIHAVNEIGAKVGQKVVIAATRPVSKTITNKIIKIIGEEKVNLEEKTFPERKISSEKKGEVKGLPTPAKPDTVAEGGKTK